MLRSAFLKSKFHVAMPQLQQLMCAPHFQRVSGRHLASTEMAFGFRFAALPGAWPALQSLGDLIGLPRYIATVHSLRVCPRSFR